MTMFFGKIPVWVYTAKNGYDWQGLDGGEEGATKTSLDKALGAAGKTAGAWGAVVRRPVASRRWAEWPRSRLCWVLFRFHPDAGRDQRGRACNYTAAACIPVGEKLPRLDFAKIFAAPEMAEVRTDGYGEMAIDLDGADYVLREPAGGGEGTEPSWDASWAVPELRREDALGTLSHWCQSEAVDRGDLKAVLREEVENGGELTAYITYAVFPQVAALQAAEEAYGAVAGQGVGATLREALAGWRKALAVVEDFNRALGGLVGLGLLVEERTRAWEEAAGAADAAERTARERAAASVAAAAAADELARAIARYRFSADAVYGKEDNRQRLAEMEQMLATGRARHGGGGRWNELEARIDHMRQWTGILEGNLDTVRTYRDAAERGGAGLAGLEAQARAALEQVRGLYQSGHGVFVSDALREMERLFGIAQAQKSPPTAMAASPSNGGNVPPRAPKPELDPVTHGYRVAGDFQPDGNGRVRDGGSHRRQEGWKRWWGRWWEVVACVATILVAAATLGGIWGGMRRGALKEWEKIRGAACQQAWAGQYSAALRTMSTLPPHKLLLLRRSRFWKELREGWEVLEVDAWNLQYAREKEKISRQQLSTLEQTWRERYQDKSIVAQDEWRAYEKAREATEGKRKSIEIGNDGLPVRWGEDPARKPEELFGLPARYYEVARGWDKAAEHLAAACRKIDSATEAEIQEEKRRAEAEAKAKAEAEDRKEKERKLGIMRSIATDLAKAQAAEAEARRELEKLEEEKGADKLIQIGRDHARDYWKRYEDCRKAAENRLHGIRFDADVPCWEKGGTEVALRDDELRGLPEAYRGAAANWRLARQAFEKACQAIEKALGKELKTQRERLVEARKKLSELESGSRYGALEHNASARGDWLGYQEARQQAMGLTKDLFPDAGGQPSKNQARLAELPGMIEACRKGEQLFRGACSKLEDGYSKLDEGGMGEEADDVPEEGAETGEETSEDKKGEGETPAAEDEPAAKGGDAGETPASPQDKDRGFLMRLFRGGGDDEPPPTRPETNAGTVPGGSPPAGTGTGAGQDGTDAGTADASSKESAK